MAWIPGTEAALRMLVGQAKTETYPHIFAVVGRIDDEQGEHVGTGFFVRLDGLLWAVTASHVVAEAIAKFGSAAMRGPEHVQIVDAWIHSDMQLDLCAAAVPVAVSTMKPIARSQLKADSNDASEHHIFIQGFPQKRGRFHALLGGVAATTLPFVTYLHHSQSRHHVADVNFPIEWPAAELDMPDEVGGHISLPQPFGMSGSPVWAMGADATSPEIPALIGVATHWDQEGRALLVTRVERLVEFLEHAARERRAYRSWCARERPLGTPWIDWKIAESTRVEWDDA